MDEVDRSGDADDTMVGPALPPAVHEAVDRFCAEMADLRARLASAGGGRGGDPRSDAEAANGAARAAF